jgi:hypothetical protein
LQNSQSLIECGKMPRRQVGQWIFWFGSFLSTIVMVYCCFHTLQVLVFGEIGELLDVKYYVVHTRAKCWWGILGRWGKHPTSRPTITVAPHATIMFATEMGDPIASCRILCALSETSISDISAISVRLGSARAQTS